MGLEVGLKKKTIHELPKNQSQEANRGRQTAPDCKTRFGEELTFNANLRIATNHLWPQHVHPGSLSKEDCSPPLAFLADSSRKAVHYLPGDSITSAFITSARARKEISSKNSDLLSFLISVDNSGHKKNKQRTN